MIDPRRHEEILTTVREMLDRGTLWLFEDPFVMREALQLLDPSLLDYLHFEEAVIQNRVLISEDLQKQEADLIFRVPSGPPGGQPQEDAYVFLVGEHFTVVPRGSVPRRFVGMTHQFWTGEEREMAARGLPPHEWRYAPVICVVLSFGRAHFDHSLDMRDWIRGGRELAAFAPSPRVLLLDLAEWEPAELTAQCTLAAYVLRVIRDVYGSAEAYRRAMEEALAGLGRLAEDDFERYRRAVWYLVQLTHHRRSQQEFSEVTPLIVGAVRQVSPQIGEEVEVVSITAAEAERQRGIQIGEEGAACGLRSLLLEVLTTKFGVESDAGTRDAVMAADLDRVSQWLARAATAPDLPSVGIRS